MSTYPTTPEFRAIGVESLENNLYSETTSGRVQVRQNGGQRWAFSAAYNPMTRQEFAPVSAFVMKQRGRFGTFNVIPPIVGSTSGNATGDVSTALVANTGASSVTVTGLSGTLKAGDFIKFEGHSKVYMVTADLTGSGTLEFFPALINQVDPNEDVIYQDVPFLVRLKNDIQSYSLSSNEYYTYEVDFIEAL